MSTVEFHPWNSRRADVEKPDEWRIDLDPMPDCPPASGAPRRRRRPRGARRARRGRLAEDVGRQRACTSTSASSRPTASPTCGRAALAFAREVERRAPARRDDDVVAQGPRPGRAVRRLQPERPRPHDGRGLLGAGRARRPRCRRRSRGTRSTPSSPATARWRPCPRRFAELGDLHAGIDDAVVRHRRAARVGGPRRARRRGRRRSARGRRRRVSGPAQPGPGRRFGPADSRTGPRPCRPCQPPAISRAS